MENINIFMNLKKDALQLISSNIYIPTKKSFTEINVEVGTFKNHK